MPGRDSARIAAFRLYNALHIGCNYQGAYFVETFCRGLRGSQALPTARNPALLRVNDPCSAIVDSAPPGPTVLSCMKVKPPGWYVPTRPSPENSRVPIKEKVELQILSMS
jgi:hypothetical protein